MAESNDSFDKLDKLAIPMVDETTGHDIDMYHLIQYMYALHDHIKDMTTRLDQCEKDVLEIVDFINNELVDKMNAWKDQI